MKTSALALLAALAAPVLPGAAAAQDAPAPIAQSGDAWFASGERAVADLMAAEANTGTARNVILFVGDGNGVASNYAIRLFMGQAAGGMGDDFVLPYEAWPHVALVKTYTTNGQTPDSAPTASALNTGIKTRNDVINVPASVAVDDCAAGLAASVTTLADIATDMGKSVGIVTTARITHATPAAVYARTVNRDWEDDTAVPEGCAQPDIAAQLARAMADGTVDLAMGGGRQHFLTADEADPENAEKTGVRTDGRDLVAEIGGQYAWNSETFAALDPAADGPVLGLFEPSHMQYEFDRTDEPSLAEMTRAAIDRLDRDPGGFYLEVEGGRIDHALHAGNLYRAVTDGAAFAEAVQAAIEMTDPAETLIIVTADHTHALAFNGYCGRGSPVTGLCYDVDPAGEMHSAEPLLGDDGRPYTVAGFLNGAGSVLVPEGEVDDDESTPLPTFSGTRPDLTDAEAEDPDYLQQALIPLGSETHSGEDVAAYATGPWSQLVAGTIEQNVLFHVMLTAMHGGDLAATAAATAPEGAAEEGTSADDTEGNAEDAAATTDATGG